MLASLAQTSHAKRWYGSMSGNSDISGFIF